MVLRVLCWTQLEENGVQYSRRMWSVRFSRGESFLGDGGVTLEVWSDQIERGEGEADV